MITRRNFCIMVGASIPAACAPDSGKSSAGAAGSEAFRAPAGIALGSAAELLKNFEWRRAPIPAGGFVTGLDISSDGSRMLHWADVFNGYIRNTGEEAWNLLLRRDTLDKAEYDPKPRTATTDGGIYAARIAPSDKNVIYASWNGFIFKSTDGGAKFTRTALAAKRMQSNMGPQRRFNRTLDVHRTDPGKVIVGTNNDGVYYTLDGGATWGSIAVPAAAQTFNTESKYLVGFGPGDVVYVHVPGSGLYRSTAGLNGQFLNVGGPLTASCLVVTPKGVVYICEYRTGNNTAPDALKRLEGSTWTALQSAPDQIAVDPWDENHMFSVGENLIGGSPHIRRTIDGGKTWTSHQFTRGSGEVAWLSNRNKGSFPAHIMFDPVVRGKLWMADGVGVTWSRLPEPTEVWTLHDYSNGNAELIPVSTVSIPNNPPILCFWDKPFWRLEDEQNPTNMWSYPVPAGKTFSENTVTVGYGLDYASDDPNFLVGVAGQGSNQNGFSTDAGKTWTEFTAKPGDPFRFGGAVAVSTTRNFITLSSNNGSGAYTLDGGQTWQPISFGGYDPVINWNNAYYVNRLNIAADKTRAGVFAAVVHNIYKLADGRDATGRDIAGLWLTRDGGKTWEQRFKGVLQGTSGSQAQFWQCRLRYVPGFTGELLYVDGDGHPANKLVWSNDDGATWSDVRSSIRNVISFGFGKSATEGGRPAVFFYGTVNGVRGVYASFDWFATEPTLLSEAPLETISSIGDVTGDLNIFGQCYVMIGGNGAAIFREIKVRAPDTPVHLPANEALVL